MHELIQRATRDNLTPDQHDRLALTAADALSAAWPDVERDTVLAQALRANTTALTRAAEDALYRPDAHTVLYQAGGSLGRSGQVIAAHSYFERLTNETRSRFGGDHPDALDARSNLAKWQGATGDLVGAAETWRQLLADQERVRGQDHPDTLTACSYLAFLRGEAGDAAGAAAAYEQILADQQRLLGPDHPSILTTRGKLAQWRGEAGTQPVPSPYSLTC